MQVESESGMLNSRRVVAGFNVLLVGVIGLLGASTSAQAAGTAKNANPDFGPNVLLFDPSMQSAEIQAQIDKVYTIQQHSEFGPARYALLFLPGEYHVDIPVGFYTQVIGLGPTPDAVHIVGNVHSDASLPRNNATGRFWGGLKAFLSRRRAGPCSGPFRRQRLFAVCTS